MIPSTIPDAEVLLLGSLVNNPSLWSRVAHKIGPEDFIDGLHRQIASAVRDLSDGEGDVASVIAVFPQAPIRERIAELATEGFSTENLEGYAELVAETHRRQLLATALREALGNVKAVPAMETLSRLEDISDRLVSGKTTGPMTFAQAIEKADERIRSSIERRKAGGSAGVTIGIPAVDLRTGGWMPGQLVVIAGRPGLGKTALMLQASRWASQRGNRGLIVSLEMGADELAIRAMASEAKVNVSRLSWGDPDSYGSAIIHTPALATLPISIETATYRLDQITALIRREASKGAQWAAVDHIGLVETNGFSHRVDQLGAISRSLKQTARKSGIPIIALSQLNRSAEKDRRRPMLSDLRDSGNIEQDADIVLMLHSETDDSEASKTVQLGLLKNRNGRKGWLPEKIEFDGAVQRFREISSPNPLHEPSRHWSETT